MGVVQTGKSFCQSKLSGRDRTGRSLNLQVSRGASKGVRVVLGAKQQVGRGVSEGVGQ